MKIFKSVVDELGSSLEQYGFKYKKTTRTALRNGRLFKHTITFGSSRSINSLEGHIHLEVRAMACSDEFGDYRRSKGIDLPINENCIFGSTIENLFIQAPPYIRYDVGDEKERSSVIHNIKKVFKEKVLMAFDLIESPQELEKFLQHNQFPVLDSFNTISDYFDFINYKDT